MEADSRRPPPGLARLVGQSFAGSLAVQLIGAAAGILTARLLGPEGKGLLVAVTLWPGLLAALGGGLGLEDAVAVFTARSPDRRGAIAAAGVLIAVAQTAVLVALGWLALPWLLRANSAALGDGRLYLAWIGLSCLTLVAMAALQGSLRFTALNTLRPLVVGATLAGLVALWLAGAAAVHGVVLVYLAAHALALLAAWLVLLRGGRLAWPDARLLASLAAFATKAQLSHLAAVANDRLDVALLALLLGPAQLGLYAVALGLSALVRLCGSSLALVTLPALVGGRDEELGRLVRATLWSSAAVGLVTAGLAPWAMGWLFGAGFTPAAGVAQVLALATVGLNASRVLGAGLKAAGLPERAGLGELIGAALTLAGMLALLPRFGLLGAGIVAALSYAASLAYLAFEAKRRLGLSPRAMFVPTRADVAWLRAACRRDPWRAAPLPA